MCVLLCVCTNAPEREMSDWTFHSLDSGFKFSESTEKSFCKPFTFILIGAQPICTKSAIKNIQEI